MKGFWKWFLIFVGVLLIAFCVALPLFMRFSGGLDGVNGFGRDFGPQGRNFGGMPMMGGRGGFFPLFGLIGHGIGGLLGLGVLGLAVYGVVMLVRNLGKKNTAPGAAPAVSADPTLATAKCEHCGNAIQTGWKACPYCGASLEVDTPAPTLVEPPSEPIPPTAE